MTSMTEPVIIDVAEIIIDPPQIQFPR